MEVASLLPISKRVWELGNAVSKLSQLGPEWGPAAQRFFCTLRQLILIRYYGKTATEVPQPVSMGGVQQHGSTPRTRVNSHVAPCVPLFKSAQFGIWTHLIMVHRVYASHPRHPLPPKKN